MFKKAGIRHGLCIIVSVSFSFLYNWNLVFDELFCSFLYVFFLTEILSRSRWAFALGTPVLFLPSAAASFFFSRFDVKMSTNIAAALIETSASEAGELLSVDFYLWIFFSVLLCIIFSGALFYISNGVPTKRDWPLDSFLFLVGCSVVFFCLEPVNHKHRYMLVIIFEISFGIILFNKTQQLARIKNKYQLLAFGIMGVLIGFCILNIKETRKFRPFDYSYYINKHMNQVAKIREALKKRFDISALPSTFDQERGNNLKVVLVLGESSRPDHFQLLGYERPTTPLLSKRSNLIAFSDVHSRTGFTRLAIPNIMTRQKSSRIKDLGRETSIITLFKKHGFHTSWITMNNFYGKSNITTSHFIHEADDVFVRKEYEEKYSYGMDGYLLPPFEKKLNGFPRQRQFIVLHTRGSHWRYDRRYPKEFEIFKPVDKLSSNPAKCDPESLVNAYDNTILFVDYFLNEVIKRLENQNAVMIYVGDHGESLGEDGIFLHAREHVAAQMHVPLIVWGSDMFLTMYGDKFDALKKCTNKNLKHDHVFHTLLGLTGFRSEQIIDQKLDLTSSSAGCDGVAKISNIEK
ncbi:MAG: sulfatase-like hydrolase/transferase [Myxococcota bacterium]|nr:sulfatase-like hydrolase/transferase [Myxococcota bacterium]